MIRIGTVGTGFIVDNFFDAVSRVPDMEVTCVYSREKEKAREFAKKHGAARYSCDRAAFLGDEALDFVYVASPNSLHFEWARDALCAGRNVICEKPFVSTSRELRELIALAREKELFLFEAITVPHLPNYRLLRAHLGDIGAPRLAQLNFSQYSSRYKAFLEGKDPNVFSPAFSGGALMDINYYNLYFLLGLFGEPQDIAYLPNLAANGIDTSGILTLRYDGTVCTAVGAKDSRSENFAQLQGERGYIYMRGESSRCLGFDVHTAEGQTHYDVQTDENALVYELRDFADIFLSKDVLRLDELFENSLLAMRMTEKARLGAGIRFPADAG
ncbi:MAG: Gfo/Idh/MocA family oxidoreductase [Oscillospiraceae bacterium]|nr:Gfo/Idh/MocA family oxidoreductase [Oscillospiraceae bacterium]